MKMYLEVYDLGAGAVAAIHGVFAIVNPANDILGAVVSDAYAARRGSRTGLLALLLALWPIGTVAPFWPQMPAALGKTRAALLGLSTEDTIYSFAAIAIGATW